MKTIIFKFFLSLGEKLAWTSWHGVLFVNTNILTLFSLRYFIITTVTSYLINTGCPISRFRALEALIATFLRSSHVGSLCKIFWATTSDSHTSSQVRMLLVLVFALPNECHAAYLLNKEKTTRLWELNHSIWERTKSSLRLVSFRFTKTTRSNRTPVKASDPRTICEWFPRGVALRKPSVISCYEWSKIFWSVTMESCLVKWKSQSAMTPKILETNCFSLWVRIVGLPTELVCFPRHLLIKVLRSIWNVATITFLLMPLLIADIKFAHIFFSVTRITVMLDPWCFFHRFSFFAYFLRPIRKEGINRMNNTHE